MLQKKKVKMKNLNAFPNDLIGKTISQYFPNERDVNDQILLSKNAADILLKVLEKLFF